jgi:putative membrane protein
MSELNDPRVFFAAERTALAWNRTALTLMAFGFAIERFGLFMHMLVDRGTDVKNMNLSFGVGVTFVLMGGIFSFFAARQYKTLLKSLKPAEIPPHYNPQPAFIINAMVAALAAVLIILLIFAHV